MRIDIIIMEKPRTNIILSSFMEYKTSLVNGNTYPLSVGTIPLPRMSMAMANGK